MLNCIREMRKNIEREMREICKEAYAEAKYYAGVAKNLESKLFYLKLIAEYFRYMCAFSRGNIYRRLFDEAAHRYTVALEMAQELDPTNPLRLALYLGYAQLHAQKKEFEEAISIGMEGFDTALDEFEQLDESEMDETIKAMDKIQSYCNGWNEQFMEGKKIQEMKEFKKT